MSELIGKSSTGNIWFSSDHHYSHANIIKYCDRPFDSVHHMNTVMSERWNEVVKDEDTVYYLGDFSMSAQVMQQVLPMLRGRKILIAGNHDKCFSGVKKQGQIEANESPEEVNKWVKFYLDAGWQEVHKQFSLEINGESVLLCHFPHQVPEKKGEPLQRYHTFRPKDSGGWLLCGHIHDSWKVNGKMINVGVDVNDFYPISLEAVAEVIKNGPYPKVQGPAYD